MRLDQPSSRSPQAILVLAGVRGVLDELIALIEEAAVIARILRHLGLPTDLPVTRSARAPPVLDGLLEDGAGEVDTSVFESAP